MNNSNRPTFIWSISFNILELYYTILTMELYVYNVCWKEPLKKNGTRYQVKPLPVYQFVKQNGAQ